MLNTELSRSKREEERLRRHVRQSEAELKVIQRRAAAGGRAQTNGSASAASRTARATSGSRASSRSSSRASSAERWCPPQDHSRSTSRVSSRAPSVASSSTVASRAGSVERGPRVGTQRTSPRAGSAEASRSSSRAHSGASSRERSQPASRSPSTERNRASSRGDTHSQLRAPPPSLQRAAHAALAQPRPEQRPPPIRSRNQRSATHSLPVREGHRGVHAALVGQQRKIGAEAGRRSSQSGRSDDSASSGPDEDEWSALVSARRATKASAAESKVRPPIMLVFVTPCDFS